MIQLIAPKFHDCFRAELAEMHRLRRRVFKDRLGWSVDVKDDEEADQYDTLKPDYLLHYCGRQLCGCVRFLSTTGPTMLRDAFPHLLGGQPAPESPDIWESSRFAIDPDHADPARPNGLSRSTYELFAGMVEFGLARQLTHIVTVTDTRVERILMRAGWPLDRISRPRQLGPTVAVAGHLNVSDASLASIRDRGGIHRPVLWRPVLDHDV